MGPLLTIAVPCYNVEWCLEKCLSSFVDKQTLGKIQVLVVNDGSSDGTEAIARRFTEQYPGSFSLINKKNGGHGSAINAAILQAEGKYFKVIDADDWVITENLIALLEILEHTEADLILTHFHTVDMSTGEKREYKTRGMPLGKLYSLEDFTRFPGDIYQCTVFHGVAWRTEVYRQSGTVLSEGIFYEDQEYATLPITKAQTILPLDLFLYQYLIGNANQSVADENQVKRLSHVEQVVRSIFVCYSQNPELPEGAKRYVARKAGDMLLSYYVIAMVKNPDKRNGRQKAAALRAEMAKTAPEIIHATDAKYRLAVTMNRLRFSGKTLERMKSPLPYAIFRKLFQKNRG